MIDNPAIIEMESQLSPPCAFAKSIALDVKEMRTENCIKYSGNEILPKNLEMPARRNFVTAKLQ